MAGKWVLAAIAAAMILGVAMADMSEETKVKMVKGKKVCTRGWECTQWSIYCCNNTISDFFQAYQFEELFAKRNAPEAHAIGFWDYQSFITAAAIYQPLGFGTTGGKFMGQKEVAAFLGHVGSKTSCKLISLSLSLMLDWFWYS